MCHQGISKQMLMESKLLYFKIHFWSFVFPFVFAFLPQFPFHKEAKFYVKSILSIAIIEIIWDVIYNKMGVWGFSDSYTIGFRMLGLPIEEFLFFITIPFCCLFLFFCASKYKIYDNWIPIDSFLQNYFLPLFAISSLIIALIYYDKWYTSVTFISLAIILTTLYYKPNPHLKYIFLTYLIVLIPFFITNGILTGCCTLAPVVFYNVNENCGFRIGTIPVEDMFYGLLLYLGNVLLYLKFKESDEYILVP
jgi:lycopene cyclase domain-containing protein